MDKASIEAYIRIKPGGRELRYTKSSVAVNREGGDTVEYEFDGVIGPEATQLQVFEMFRSVVPRLMEGYNQTIFCYGSTGSGKTHTMVGSEESRGLMFNLAQEILEHGEFFASYMEIYNEKIYDLLEPKELALREFNKLIVVPNLFLKRIESMSEFESVLKQGIKNRTTAETKLNKSSSRSHGILRICVGDSKLNLIDLAGSENNRKTGNEGIRLTESNNINRSLFVLGNVVNAILKKENRVPYRDSKLTRLLQDSLGGRSLCYIIANVINDRLNIGDSISTLSFASKSRKIVNNEIICNRSHEDSFAGIVDEEKCLRMPLSVKTNTRFNMSRAEGYKKNGGIQNEYNYFRSKACIQFDIENDKVLLSLDKQHQYGTRTIAGDKISNTDKRPSKRINGNDSGSLILKSIVDKPEILLSPRTKEKSYKAFLKRASGFESAHKYRLALEDYRTIQKFCDNEFVRQKIESIGTLFKKPKRNIELTKEDVLAILNKGNFFDIKKLPKVGDKRAQVIVDFVNEGNLFETVADLKLLFSTKVVDSILLSISKR
ncbi:kinesin motor domain-containing protein [Ordospora colligata]|uniref:Kinesin-like protein n=1 Tax=Ordospora colligata OC4 TaxID=1354746 RepID=A0A0B2UD20_9MICR|nr:kinesin motor domain-containing protein [Ordospora colligata OC4]KHN68966.1 kinesin motor domain-containing protein [Ordospora colligata OC4]TBU14000.1 kinesin motor domain-containing protein [Ordospora colligata]TBU14189.1 kinesin motor domain-containing protein [Ordospora colligata]TBU17858.1 kinesin motor domain-containing protein [Ordospora colligata]